jgi:hypothetical protein
MCFAWRMGPARSGVEKREPSSAAGSSTVPVLAPSTGGGTRPQPASADACATVRVIVRAPPVIQFAALRLQGIVDVARAVFGCGFEHRPGARFINWRRDAASTRKRGRLRYASFDFAWSRMAHASLRSW